MLCNGEKINFAKLNKIFQYIANFMLKMREELKIND